jgi:hypothetical protein
MTCTPVAPQEQEAIHVLMTMITWCKNSEYEKATDLMTDDVQWKTPVFYFDGKSSGSKNSDAQLSVHQHLKTRKLREQWTEMWQHCHHTQRNKENGVSNNQVFEDGGSQQRKQDMQGECRNGIGTKRQIIGLPGEIPSQNQTYVLTHTSFDSMQDISVAIRDPTYRYDYFFNT